MSHAVHTVTTHIWRCDRCCATANTTTDRPPYKWFSYKVTGNAFTTDLCELCYANYREWLRNPPTLSRG